MKVYIVLINDRHTDIEVEAFSSDEKAIDYARKTAKEYCGSPEIYEESQISDWLFYARYSSEEDYVRVVEREIDIK